MIAVGVHGPQPLELAKRLHDHAVTFFAKIVEHEDLWSVSRPRPRSQTGTKYAQPISFRRVVLESREQERECPDG